MSRKLSTTSKKIETISSSSKKLLSPLQDIIESKLTTIEKEISSIEKIIELIKKKDLIGKKAPRSTRNSTKFLVLSYSTNVITPSKPTHFSSTYSTHGESNYSLHYLTCKEIEVKEGCNASL